MKNFVLIFMLMAGVCCATDYYVDPAKADDTGDGLTTSTAKKTVAAAYALAGASGDGHTVNLMAGTYTTATQGASWFFNLDQGVSVTFKSYTTQVTVTCASVNGCIYMSLATTSLKTINFENIFFSHTLSDKRYIRASGACTEDIILTDCVFDPALTFPITLYDAEPTALKKLSLINCTWSGNVQTPIQFVDMRTLRIEGGTYVHTHASAITIARPQGIVHNIIFKDVTFTALRGVLDIPAASLTKIEQIIVSGCDITITSTASATYSTIAIPDVPVSSLVVKDNTFTSTAASNFKPNFIVFGTATTANPHAGIVIGNTFTSGYTSFGAGVIPGNDGNVSVINNTFNDLQYAVLSHNGIFNVYGNIANNCVNGVFANGGTGVIANNTFIIDDQSHGDSRCILLNRHAFISETNSTTFTSSTVVYGVAKTLTADMIGNLCVVTTNPGSFTPTHFGVISAVNDGTDTITVDEWRRVADDAINTPANSLYSTVLAYPKNVAVYNNILDAGAALSTITFDNNPLSWGVYYDYNCYVAGTAILSNLGNGLNGNEGVDTLAELQTRWSEYLASYEWGIDDNDQHSLEFDPQFTDEAGGVFSLPSSSPCFNTGLPTLSGGITTIGAWQPGSGGATSSVYNLIGRNSIYSRD